ncbi:MAG: maleylpyruvate isomerase N-terminal domain-containing protein [Acidobacteria bacterium]|nr:maleylpyruvate isomerase N-terminal domain-containing protein [Acidobacteriota bacterium]
MKPVEPIYLTELFPILDLRLIELLNDLSTEDWEKPTVCPLWNVKDIAAHLLDTNFRRLSSLRDNYSGEQAVGIDSYQDLVDFLNRLNADWVIAAKRLSPRILIDLLEQTGHQVYQVFNSLEPNSPAIFPVAWAGEDESANWFDIAREYTEKWHHQQQIRMAVNRPGIMEREIYFPVLDTFMRALPFTYKDVDAEEGTLLRFRITGEAGGEWYLLRNDRRWQLLSEAEVTCISEVSIDQNIAWRLFTKGIDREEARLQIIIKGKIELGSKILGMLSVMA